MAWNFLTKKIDKEGRTPLINSVLKGDKKLLLNLLKRGVQVNVSDNHGRTALMYAFIKGDNDSVNILLQHKADINHTDKNNESVLIWYIDAGQKEIVRFLLKLGADPNMGMKNGKTPVMLAAEKGYDEIVKILISQGANIFALDSNNRSCLSYIKSIPWVIDTIINIKNLLHVYKSKYYQGKDDDLILFLNYFKEKNDYSVLHEFFFNTKEDDWETRLRLINNDLPYVNDPEILLKMKEDFPKIWSLFTKIQLLKDHPLIYGELLTSNVLESLFIDIEKDDSRETRFRDYITVLNSLDYEVIVDKITCSLCNGKGLFSDYSSANENDNYSYPCDCFEGKALSVTLKKKGNIVITYQSKRFKNK